MLTISKPKATTPTALSDNVTPVEKPRLLDQMRAIIRTRHYSYATEKTYLQWAKRFILFHGKRHPAEMGAPEVEAFLLDMTIYSAYVFPVTVNSVAGIGLPMWSGESRMLCGFFASSVPLRAGWTGSRKARRCSTGSPTRSVPPTPIGQASAHMRRRCGLVMGGRDVLVMKTLHARPT